MKVKVVDGVLGNHVVRDYRRSQLPKRAARFLRWVGGEAAFWLLTAILVGSIAVFGFAVGISLLGAQLS